MKRVYMVGFWDEDLVKLIAHLEATQFDDKEWIKYLKQVLKGDN